VKGAKRGKYVKRRPRRPVKGPRLYFTNQPSTAVTISYTPGITYTAVIDPDEWAAEKREEACRRVDELAGQRGKDGRKLTRNERIFLAHEQCDLSRYGLTVYSFRNYVNGGKPRRPKNAR
jgi:hypothetical protein